MGNESQVSGNITAEDLRLPRPPGIIRAFWNRHPVLTDSLIAIVIFLLTLPSHFLVRDDSGALHIAVGLSLSAISAGSLMFRRRYPVAAFIAAFSLAVILHPEHAAIVVGIAPSVAVYSIAVYRSNRAAAWTLAIAVVAVILGTSVWALASPIPWNGAISHVTGTAVLLLIPALIGINLGNRRRYVEALIERSRQLAIERDQQAQLAAAAERTRIAREMHDIVSHSLAVVVTLAEGAHATNDQEQSKRANRAIADTARDALEQMRAMLGVLRAEPNAHPEGAPREPLLDVRPVDVVHHAQAAGVPATLTVTGEPYGNEMERLVVLRIVQESLTNAMRYGPEASYISASLDYSDAGIQLSVENDGIERKQASVGSGVGLQGLRERVSSLGGTFHAGPSPRGTWVVSANIPKEEHRD